ncbi:MAG: hypothetical protein CYPHOPRED_004422, partial [Cyphobasidiales sp. Tagirdzhanova-0007]
MDPPSSDSSHPRSSSHETIAGVPQKSNLNKSADEDSDGDASTPTKAEQPESGRDTPLKSASSSVARSTSFSPATVANRNISPSHTQAALGRGRAPTLQSQASFGPSASPNSGNTISATQKATSFAKPPGQGRRSMPSTAHTLAFSDLPSSSDVGGTSHQTDAESLLSADEDGPSHRYDQSSQQQNARRSRLTLKHTQSLTGSRNGRIGIGQLKPPSTAAPKDKTRAKSRTRKNGDSSSSGDDDGPRSARRGETDDDAINVLPVALSMTASQGMDDDEVERRDRGEELVRRRMRERKREKKDAERRERKKRDEETKRDRERQLARAQKITGVVGGQTDMREFMASEMPVPAIATNQDERPSLSRRNSDPTTIDGA